jgi:hypothetical protein
MTGLILPVVLKTFINVPCQLSFLRALKEIRCCTLPPSAPSA